MSKAEHGVGAANLQLRGAMETRYRALIEDGLELLLLMDASGSFTYVSPSVTRILGYTREQLLAAAPLELIHPDDRAQSALALVQLVEGTLERRLEFRVRHQNGSWRVMQSSARNMLAVPDVCACVINARDITHERKLEQQLHQAARLESIGRLASGIAHDFNNILTAIQASTVFLLEAAEVSESARGDLDQIAGACDRAGQLTHQLLAFARKHPSRAESIDLGEVIAAQKLFLRRLIMEHIDLDCVLDPNLWPVRIDRGQLEQILLNLAVNARDAMPAGGCLTFETRNVVLDTEFADAHPEISPGPHVRLSVSDCGEGIAPEALPHVFEPFFTTKAACGGSGLGLAMVHGIVRQAGGHIGVHSEANVGTTFTIYFPRASEACRRPAVLPVATSSGSSHERILVVDDDPSVRAVLVRTLKGVGYTVHDAATAADALALAARARFDLLVTDIVMPGLSGTQLAAQLLPAHPGLRVLYLSGYADRDTVAADVELLAKPFSPLNLRRRVRSLLDRDAVSP